MSFSTVNAETIDLAEKNEQNKSYIATPIQYLTTKLLSIPEKEDIFSVKEINIYTEADQPVMAASTFHFDQRDDQVDTESSTMVINLLTAQLNSTSVIPEITKSREYLTTMKEDDYITTVIDDSLDFTEDGSNSSLINDLIDLTSESMEIFTTSQEYPSELTTQLFPLFDEENSTLISNITTEELNATLIPEIIKVFDEVTTKKTLAVELTTDFYDIISTEIVDVTSQEVLLEDITSDLASTETIENLTEYTYMIELSPCSLLETIPSVKDYIIGLSLPWLVLTVVGVAAGIIILALWLDMLVHIQRRLRLWYLKAKLLWIVGIYPVYTTACIVGLIIPRTAILTDLFASVYLSVGVYQFWIYVIALHDGVQQMEERLGGSPMPINSCPVLCCCPCLPKPFISRRSVLCFEILILQYCILKPLLILVPAAVGLDSGSSFLLLDSEMDLKSYKAVNIACVVSTVLAIYALAVMCNLSSHPLRGLHIRAKTVLLQYTLVFINIQHCIIPFIVWILYDYNLMPCILLTYDLGTEARRLHMFLLLIELMIITITSRHYYQLRVPTGQTYYDLIDDEDLAMMEYCRSDQRHLK